MWNFYNGPDMVQEAMRHHAIVMMEETLTNDQAFINNLHAKRRRERIVAKATGAAKEEFKMECKRRDNAQDLAVMLDLQNDAFLHTIKTIIKENFPDHYKEAMAKAQGIFEKKKHELYQDRDLIDAKHENMDRVIYNQKYVFPHRGRRPLDDRKIRELMAKHQKAQDEAKKNAKA